MRLRDIPDHGYFQFQSCKRTLQVSHKLGGDKVVVKTPSNSRLDRCEFSTISGNTEVKSQVTCEFR